MVEIGDNFFFQNVFDVFGELAAQIDENITPISSTNYKNEQEASLRDKIQYCD